MHIAVSTCENIAMFSHSQKSKAQLHPELHKSAHFMLVRTVTYEAAGNRTHTYMHKILKALYAFKHEHLRHVVYPGYSASSANMNPHSMQKIHIVPCD